MDSYNVIGVENINYTSRKTNKKVMGTKLYLTYEFDERADADGTACEVVFVKNEIGDCIEVGDVIKLIYNKYGSIDGVEKLQEV